MKTVKLIFAIIALALIANRGVHAQTMHVNVVVVLDEYDFTPYIPFLGVVSGSYTYAYSFKLNKQGKIERVHWVVKDCNLYNHLGETVKIIDTGIDNLGVIWEFWNKPNEGNGFDPGIVYSIDDGWLDGYLPDDFPIEGRFVNMSLKLMIKGQKWADWAGMVQLHRNSKGEITAYVVKP